MLSNVSGCGDLSKLISMHATEIVHAINGMSNSISGAIDAAGNDATVAKIGFAVFVAFVGAFSAFIFNIIHWKVAQKRQDTANLANSLIGLINSLESLAIEYWMNDYDKTKEHSTNVAEVQIKAVLRQIGKYSSVFVQNLKGRNYRTIQPILEGFVSEVYDLVTGDGFESTIRQSSKAKAVKIAKECSDARVVISSMLIRF